MQSLLMGAIIVATCQCNNTFCIAEDRAHFIKRWLCSSVNLPEHGRFGQLSAKRESFSLNLATFDVCSQDRTRLVLRPIHIVEIDSLKQR
jgi:hypothetical protein